MKPICVPCQRFFRCIKTGTYFTEAMPTGDERAEPGTSQPEKWRPYKIWSGDMFKCEGCGAVIISGVAQQPVAEHFENDFGHYMKSLDAGKIQINDC